MAEDKIICPICLDEINDKKIYITLPCNHKMHYSCGSNALQSSTLCPMCRKDTKDVKDEVEEPTATLERDIGESSDEESSDSDSDGIVNIIRDDRRMQHENIQMFQTIFEQFQSVFDSQHRFGNISRSAIDRLVNGLPIPPAPQASAPQEHVCQITATCAREQEFLNAQERDEPTITLFCKELTGRTGTYHVAPSDYIGHLHQDIEKKSGTPYGQYKLLHAGRQLEHMRQFSDYNIQINSTLHMVLNLRGGKPVILYKSPTKEICRIQLNLPIGCGMSAVYPHTKCSDNEHTWIVKPVDTTGHLQVIIGDKLMPTYYPYIFYEFDADYRLFKNIFSPQIEIRGDYQQIGSQLHTFAVHLGLDVQNCADFVTYWLPQMMEIDEISGFQIQFLQDDEFNKMIPITVEPKPDIMHRFFMLWKKCDLFTNAKIEPRMIQSFPQWSSVNSQSYLLEWGGMKIL